MRQPVRRSASPPTPQPTELRHNPTADEFQQWCEHPVTRWVAKAYAVGHDGNLAAWADLLTKPATPEELARARIELSTRADAYAAFLETTHADYLKRNDEQEWIAQYGKARDS